MILNDKFCTKCGRYLENNRRYCPECGMPQFAVNTLELSRIKCFALFVIPTIISTVLSSVFISLNNIYVVLLLIPVIVVLGRRKTIFGVITSGLLLGILLGSCAGPIYRILTIATGAHF